MLSLRNSAIFFVITVWCMVVCRSDHVEGSRILEEAFRDYDKRIRPNYGGSPVVVNISIYILSLPEIDTARNIFKLSFFIRQIWTDPRFFFSSRRNIDTITLDASTSEKIWSPDTFFVNELSSVDHNLLAKNQFCRISQNGTVLLSRRVTLSAFVPMDSSFFPYDSQNLVLDLESYGFQTKDMKYQWADESVSSGSLTPPGFTIENIVGTDTSLTTSTGSYSRLTVSIKAKRKAFNYELGIMLPTTLLAILCWGSLYTKNATTGAATTVYLVSIMVLMNGLLVINDEPSGIVRNIPCLTPLQIHLLMSCAFGLLCLIVNLKRERSDANGGNPNESKSSTESTSQNTDELPYDATKGEKECASANGEKCNGIRRCVRRCRSKLTGRVCVRCSLLAILLLANIIFCLLFRNLF